MALCLTRQQEERVQITCPDGTQITVAVIGFRRRKGVRAVRLAFEAPKSYTIHREEVQREIDKEAEA